MKPKNHTVFALALFFTGALAGCGGGGGSSGGGSSGNSLENTFLASLQSGTARTQTESAAGATPKQGSVTQTSNVHTVSGVTQDTINAEATYSGTQLSITITHEDEGGTRTILDSDSDVVILEEDVDVQSGGSAANYRRRVLGRLNNNEAVFAEVYTDRLTAADTDYLVGGVWVSFPLNIASLDGLEIGAFMDGPNPAPRAYLQQTSTASYDGGATGLYVGEVDGDPLAGQFFGGVALNASFGTNPTISGTVNIEEEATGGTAQLTLGTANIDTTADGGFFTGNTSGDLDGNNYAGKWGGQFYGDEAERVGGTFGAATDNPDFKLSFVGAFGAEKISP